MIPDEDFPVITDEYLGEKLKKMISEHLQDGLPVAEILDLMVEKIDENGVGPEVYPAAIITCDEIQAKIMMAIPLITQHEDLLIALTELYYKAKQRLDSEKEYD